MGSVSDLKALVCSIFLCQQSDKGDIRHVDPEFVREPVPGMYISLQTFANTC